MTSKKPGVLSSRLLIAIAAGAGLLAGVAAVYVMESGSGNGPDLSSQTSADMSECQIPAAKKTALKAAAKGEVAAMTPLDMPRRLDQLAFLDPQGKPVSLGDFRGKSVLLNLWATWCFPCREEMPALDRLEGQSDNAKFSVVAVNIDSGGDDKPKAFLKEAGIIHLPYYRDRSLGVFNDLKREGLALGLPVTLLIDPKGCVLGAMNGPAAWDGPEARALIDAAGK